MSAQDDARIVLCRVCNRQLCDYPCNKIHLMSEIIAEAQLEAVEKAFSLRPLSLCVNYDESITAYMHKLKKAAGRGER